MLNIKKILTECELPVEVTDGEVTAIVTAMNSAYALITFKETGLDGTINLHLEKNDWRLKEDTVKLYRYTYNDIGKKEKITTRWTTQSFQDYFGPSFAYSIFELTSTEIKEVEV